MQGQADRVNYLMTKQAKIVAMTCTHAALKRREFLQLGLKYDNLLMEESAQILEIETFIPMLLQVCPPFCCYQFLHNVHHHHLRSIMIHHYDDVEDDA